MSDQRDFDHYGPRNRHFDFREVHLESGTLELETGEVFAAPFAKLDDSTISANLFYIAKGEAVGESEMQYWSWPTTPQPPMINFELYASPSEYGELVTNIRSGLVPETVCVKLAEGSRYWHRVEPTNRYSKTIWKNEVDSARGCAVIPIEGHAFTYIVKRER